MSDLIYNLNNMSRFRINIDLEKFIYKENETLLDNILNVNLINFKLSNFQSLNIFFDRLKESIPLPLIAYEIRDLMELKYSVDLGVYSKKVELKINKTKDTITLSDDPNKVKIGKKELNINILKEIETDLNYLLGLIIGDKIKKDTKLKINGNLGCVCRDIYYDKYFDDLSNITANILNKENYNVTGYTFEYVSKLNSFDFILDTRISKTDEDEELYRINFESTMMPPIKISNIIELLFNEMNGINKILCDL